jgi:hypothetical protein
MKRMHLFITMVLGALTAIPTLACQSEVTLSINSSNYSGLINIELREGRRPGSKVIRRNSVDTRGTVTIPSVCPGTYFFAFSTPKDETVSVTRYFDVTDDGNSYSNPSITVTYSRVSSGGQRVGSAKKSEL